MENLLDRVWEYVYALILKGTATLDFLLGYLHFLGPVVVIFFLAAVTIALTRVLKRYSKTKRLVTLEKDFQYWLSIREEAMRCEDREKGKALAKNIDQAKLNKAYYDYFFEGLMLGFITFYLPVISMASYINEAYRSERLLDIFGRDYVFKFNGDDPVLFGALFWFISAVVLINSGIFIIKWTKKRYWTARIAKSDGNTGQSGHCNERVLEQSAITRCA